MGKETITIEHKEERKQGILYLFSTLISAIVFWFMRDQFVEWAARWFLPMVVVLELLVAIYYVYASKRQEILDAEGIRRESVFGSKIYSWSDICKFEIKWEYGRQKMFAWKNEKLPYIRLVYSNPRRELRFKYREDIEQCIRRFYGAPERDTWSAEKNK